MTTRWSFLDPNTVACLCDCGTRDYIAGAAIAADGTTHLVLARVDARCIVTTPGAPCHLHKAAGQ